MRAVKRGFLCVALLTCVASSLWCATFGTVVPIGGHASDIALDDYRNVLYIANYTANRIEILDRSKNNLKDPLLVSAQPSSIALSPDSRYLVVGHYQIGGTGGVTILDLTAGVSRTLTTPGGVLAVAFGNGSKALVVSGPPPTPPGGGDTTPPTVYPFQLLDPVTGTFQPLDLPQPAGNPPPVPFATFPPEIIKASSGVSGDGNTIYIVADQTSGSPSSPAYVVSYSVNTGALLFTIITSSPILGPREISVDKTGSTVLVGWALYAYAGFQTLPVLLAEFPAPTGTYNAGSHAIDYSRGLVYGHIPVGTAFSGGGSGSGSGSGSGGTGGGTATAEPPVLTIFDADNLAVRERLKLQESLGGRSLLTKDAQTMYAISDSGVTIFPIGSLSKMHRVAASTEDVVFLASGCNQQVVTQQFDVVDPGGGQTDFTLSTSSPAVHLSPSSGTTPARITVSVDLAAFSAQKGTTAIPVILTSSAGMDVAQTVRVLVNTREPNQRGTIINVPGKLVDLLADPGRNRFYVIRQDKNLVLVFDGSSYQQIAALRTGNTPTQMAMTLDRRYLIVGNDNSQIASVFNLDTLQADIPIVFPAGHYPRSFAVSTKRILATARVVGELDYPCTPALTAAPQIEYVDLVSRTATPPCTLGIYTNSIDVNTALTATPTGSKIFAAMADGTVLLYEAAVDTFVASRQDFTSLAGSYVAVSDNLFLADNHLLNRSLVFTADLENSSGNSSGFVFVDGLGVRTTVSDPAVPATISRVDLSSLQYIRPTLMAEAAATPTSLTTPQDGQIGQMISPFTRTLAALSNRQAYISLSTSGFTVLPWNYDDVVAQPVIQGVVNSADYAPGVAPGGLISVFGNNMATGSFSAGQLPLPTVLGEACLTVNGELVPLLFTSSGQINGQLPFDTVGQATMVLRTAGGVSSPFTFQVLAAAPAIFRSGTAGPITSIATIFRTTNNELVTLSNPVHPQDYLIIYATGLGAVTGDVKAGDPAPFEPLAMATTPPTVTLGDVKLPVLYAGLVPGQVGLYQINVGVPMGTPDGLQIPLTILQGGYSLTLNVRVVH